VESALLCPDGEPFHLVATNPDSNLSKWMHQLKTACTVYFNRRVQELWTEEKLVSCRSPADP
jgi:hypothetical protein